MVEELERSRDAEERIIEAAARVFARYGYFNAPVQLIAQEAGVSKGLVFWHFRTKEELVVRVAERALPSDVIRKCIDSGLKGKDLLYCIGESYLKKYEDEVNRLLFINTLALSNVNEKMKEELRGICSELLERVAEMVYGDAGKESVTRIRSFFGGLMCYTLNPPENISREEYLENLINLVFPPAQKEKSSRRE